MQFYVNMKFQVAHKSLDATFFLVSLISISVAVCLLSRI